MDIGFIHQGIINSEGVGSTHSANLIPLRLADSGHDVTIYCPVRPGETPETDRSVSDVANVRFFEVPKSELRPRRKFEAVGKGIDTYLTEYDQHDIVHSYESPIAALADVREQIATPVVTTLNCYGQICPKKDLFHDDSEPCRENGLGRCTKCVVNSTFTSGSPETLGGASVLETYSGLKSIPATGYVLLQRLSNLQSVAKNEGREGVLDAYHVQADHLIDTYTSFGFSEEQFHTVPNMLDTDFLVDHRSDFTEPFRLLYVGSLKAKKGPQKLPAVMEYLENNTDAEYELTVVGGGVLQSHLEEQIAEKDVNGSVAGRVPYEELPDVYASHDIFVYPGIWEEPFARVFLEALATGTPIVGSSVGDLETIVGEAGVATDGSISGLAEGIVEISDRETLSEMSQAANRRARQYEPSEVIPQFEAFYRRVIQNCA